MARKRNKNKRETKLFRGLKYRVGDNFATILNHDTSYGDEKKRRYIISTLKAVGIQKILVKYKKGVPVFVSLETFFKVKIH